VLNEDEVYEACLRWLNHAAEQRKTDFHLVSDSLVKLDGNETCAC
jgi:hypothetical protein